MNKPHKYILFAFANFIASIIIPAPAHAKPCNFNLGFNLMHVHIDTNAQSSCRADNKSAMVERSWNILFAYSEKSARQQFQQQLRQMAANAPEMRTLVWFRHRKSQQEIAKQADKIGVIDVFDGKADPTVLANVSALVSDAASSGLSRLIIAFAPIANANPSCKRQEWGDCFEENLLPNTWSFMSDVIAAAKSAPHQGMELVFDLGNEMCVGVHVAEAYKREYAATVLTGFREKFGQQGFTISCHGNSAKAVESGLQELADTFSQFKMTPALYDIHVYFEDEKEAEAAIRGADRVARNHGRPLIVGETYFDSTVVLKAADKVARQRGSALTSVLFWPKPAGGLCNFMIGPPFSFGGAVSECAAERGGN